MAAQLGYDRHGLEGYLGNVGLIEIVRAVGLDEDAARDVLAERRFQDAVDADWGKSHALGVTGVPTFVVGAQPYEALEQLLTKAGARPKAESGAQ